MHFLMHFWLHKCKYAFPQKSGVIFFSWDSHEHKKMSPVTSLYEFAAKIRSFFGFIGSSIISSSTFNYSQCKVDNPLVRIVYIGEICFLKTKRICNIVLTLYFYSVFTQRQWRKDIFSRSLNFHFRLLKVHFFSMSGSDLSSLSLGSEPPNKKSKKRYYQKYRPEWEDSKGRKEWLESSKNSNFHAFCKICGTFFQSKLENVQSHEQSRAHGIKYQVRWRN